ncbi:MAG: hypothetical protein Q4A15_07800, partial [Prevotellaceae bacterium]|nr:hypothetical protein [Prevotellaceae bacterium]
MKNKILSIIVCISLILTCIPASVFADSAYDLSIGVQGSLYSVKAGESVEIPIILSHDAIFDSMQFKVDYDSDVFSLDIITKVNRAPYIDAEPVVNGGTYAAGSQSGIHTYDESDDYLCVLKFTANSDVESSIQTISFVEPDTGSKYISYRNNNLPINWGSCDVAVQGAIPTLADTLEILDSSNNPVTTAVTADATNDVTLQAKAYSQKGTDITSGVQWSVAQPQDAKAGSVIINESTGAITVDKCATAGEYTITATPDSTNSQGDAKTVTLNVTRETPVPTTITLSGDVADMTVPATDTNAVSTNAYTVAVNDQYGTAISNPELEWTVTYLDGSTAKTSTNIFVNSDKKLEVANGLKDIVKNTTGVDFTVTVKVKNTDLSDTDTVKVSRAASVAQSLTISENDSKTSLDVPTDTTNATATFTAAVEDQYGETISEPSVTWTLWNGNTQVTGGGAISISDNVVTVTKDASSTITDTTGITYTVKAASDEKSAEYSLTVKRAAAVPTTITLSGDVADMTVPA